MAKKNSETLKKIVEILDFVDEEAMDLWPAARWIQQASRGNMTPEHPTPPSLDLRELEGLLSQRMPELGRFLGRLTRNGDSLESIRAEILLDQLCHQRGWKHPSQVSLNPPLQPLMEACRGRLERSRGMQRIRLLEVLKRLEPAVRLSRKASRKRRRLASHPDQPAA